MANTRRYYYLDCIKIFAYMCQELFIVIFPPMVISVCSLFVFVRGWIKYCAWGSAIVLVILNGYLILQTVGIM
ncbi:Manganese transport protein [Lactiplantibacillus plantarum]|nr:Manganese transport protein [Lactiplantibacillus plantarum]